MADGKDHKDLIKFCMLGIALMMERGLTIQAQGASVLCTHIFSHHSQDPNHQRDFMKFADLIRQMMNNATDEEMEVCIERTAAFIQAYPIESMFGTPPPPLH